MDYCQVCMTPRVNTTKLNSRLELNKTVNKMLLKKHCAIDVLALLSDSAGRDSGKTVAHHGNVSDSEVGLSKYYPFDDNSYPTYEYSNGSDMGLLDFIKTADPRKVRAVEVQKAADQVTLLESIKDCFMPLVIPAAWGSSSAAAADVPVPTEERQEDVAPEDAYLNLADPDEDAIAVRQGEERVVLE
ncbi:hypothetical protein Tco_1523247 [Tanacetum coccineum]